MPIKLKRIYKDATGEDGLRILVDRVWPRGISKEKAKLDHWLKEVAPTTELRKWFSHDTEKYGEFKRKYKEELANGEQQQALDRLKQLAKDHDGDVTLLYAAKDEVYNQAQVLKIILEKEV